MFRLNKSHFRQWTGTRGCYGPSKLSITQNSVGMSGLRGLIFMVFVGRLGLSAQPWIRIRLADKVEVSNM